uniref:Uncharacterized protein n=1 Tax=Glycine max TaxID=3847 RepID=C6T3D8_SOYBN|nr:unknown [Glycine max]
MTKENHESWALLLCLLTEKASPCLIIQNLSISSALRLGMRPAIKFHLSPTSLYILRMRSSSCSLMCMTFHSLLPTSEVVVAVVDIFAFSSADEMIQTRNSR